MKQDIKFNVWVLISSVLQILMGAVCLVAGVVLAIMGLVSTDKLLKIKELNFFINQEGIIKLQKELFGSVLSNKYMCLIIGSIFVIAGIILLVFAIVEMLYVKKYKVVNHRVALMLFALIPLAIAGCIEIYLLFEYDILKLNVNYIKNIRIACFAICGVLSACAVFKLLGVLFSKSEQFMSSDNSKYAFEGPKTNRLPQGNHPASRVPVNQVNNQPAPRVPVNQVNNQPISQISNQSNMQLRNQSVNGMVNAKNSNAIIQQGFPRTTNAQVRPNPTVRSANPQVRPLNPQVRPNSNAQPNNVQARPNSMISPMPNQQGARPIIRQGVVQQPNNTTTQRTAPIMMQRPMMSGQGGNPNTQVRQPQHMQVRRCPRCGKNLLPNERVCTNCNRPNN